MWKGYHSTESIKPEKGRNSKNVMELFAKQYCVSVNYQNTLIDIKVNKKQNVQSKLKKKKKRDAKNRF